MAARVAAPPRRRHPSPHPTLTTPHTVQCVTTSAKPVALAWSPTGTYLAVATQHGPVLLFYVLRGKSDVVRANPIRTFRAHTADVLHMAFSRTDFLLTASMDRAVRLWHADTNVCLRRFAHPDMVTSVAFHPLDENFVISGGCDGVARVWRPADHACIAQTDVGAVVTAAQFGSDGKRAFIGTYDGRVLVLLVRDLLAAANRAAAAGSASSSPAASHDLPPLGPRTVTKDMLSTAPVLQVGTTVDIRQKRVRRKSPGPKVGGMCVDAGQKEMIVVGSDARVHVVGRDGEVISRYRANVRRDGTIPLGSSLSPDGRFMLHDAVGGVLRMIDLHGGWKGQTGRRRDKELSLGVEKLPVMLDANVSCASFAPPTVLDNVRPGRDNSGRVLMAVGADNGSVRIIESMYAKSA